MLQGLPSTPPDSRNKRGELQGGSLERFMGQQLGLADPPSCDCGQRGMTVGRHQAGTFRNLLEGPPLLTLPRSKHLGKQGAAQLSQEALDCLLGESCVRHPCSVNELSCPGD